MNQETALGPAASSTPAKDAPKYLGAAVGPLDSFEQMIRLTVADGDASPRTIKAYTKAIDQFFRWCMAHDLTPHQADLPALQAYRLELTGRYKTGTVKLYLRAVRLFYDALVRYNKRPDNPAANIRAPRSRTTDETNVIRKALSVEETKKLIDVLPDGQTAAGRRDRAVILLMLLQGLRASEVAGVEGYDIDPLYHQLFVRGKGRKVRHITLVRETGLALKAVKGSLCSGAVNTPMFNQLDFEQKEYPRPTRISVRTVERIADKYLNFAGLKKPGRSAHALRHTYGMLAVLGGAERERIGVSMGHASLATTDIYIRAAAEFQANPAEAVTEILRNHGDKQDG